MFSELRVNAENRLSEVKKLLDAIKLFDANLKSDEPPIISEEEVNILKGLFFVHLYGISEFFFISINSAIVDSINQDNLRTIDLLPSILSIAMHDDWNDLFQNKNSKETQDFWKKKLKFSIKSRSSDSIFIPIKATCFVSGNIQIKHFEDLLDTFSVEKSGLFTENSNFLIDWVQILRNRIDLSHGNKSASAIGGKYEVGQIENYYLVTKKFINDFINCFEKFCQEKKFKVNNYD